MNDRIVQVKLSFDDFVGLRPVLLSIVEPQKQGNSLAVILYIQTDHRLERLLQTHDFFSFGVVSLKEVCGWR